MEERKTRKLIIEIGGDSETLQMILAKIAKGLENISIETYLEEES